MAPITSNAPLSVPAPRYILDEGAFRQSHEHHQLLSFVIKSFLAAWSGSAKVPARGYPVWPFFEMAVQLAFDHILHQPLGLIAPSTCLQVFSPSHSSQLSQRWLPFGES